MGLFDFLRKSKRAGSPGPTSGEQAPSDEPGLPQLSYDVAYFVLPHYAFEDLPKIRGLCVNSPSAAGPFFYVMACTMRKVEPTKDDASRFRWHTGERDGLSYFVCEYPPAPPVDFSGMDVSAIAAAGARSLVLAPHFSGIVCPADDPTAVRYFVLGQSPIPGRTTLRSVTRDGVNCNLGVGPEPLLDRFLDTILRNGDDRAPIASVRM